MSPVARRDPGRGVALAMADLLESYGDFAGALGWLEVYAEQETLPRAYSLRRHDLIRRARRPGADQSPRTHRRRVTVGTLGD
jgi:hypothetical protein